MLARDFVGALQIAEEVKLLAPKEPSIYELLSRICNQLGRKVKAITCGNLAVAYGKGIYGHSGDDLGSQDDTFQSNEYENSTFDSTAGAGLDPFQTPEPSQIPSRLNFTSSNNLSTPTIINSRNTEGPITGSLSFTPIQQIPSSNNNLSIKSTTTRFTVDATKPRLNCRRV